VVQQKLLPDLAQAPLRDRLHFAASFVPETDVGGDYFDVDRLGAHTLAVVFADVSGHGMSAALVTVIIKTTFHSWIEQGQPMAEFITDLNHRLCRLTPDDSFAALAVATYDTQSRRLQYSNCGHNPPPRLVRGNGDGVAELDGARGMILGAIEEAEPVLADVILQPGDKVVFATDGITEAVDDEKRMFGVERLDAFLEAHRDAPAQGLVARLVEEVARFTGSAPQKDDQTILALQVR
jgi:sigma-B regulation protein RsbU (phosphoserine phosphatase)